MSRTALTEIDLLNQTIEYTWQPLFTGLSKQLDDCCERHNGGIGCPVALQCNILWNRISCTKGRLTVQEFTEYSKQIAGLRGD